MKDKIRNIIEEVLKLTEEQKTCLKNDSNLIDFGLDSLSAVEIIVNIESEFDIMTDDDDLLIENLASIDLLSELVNKYKNE